MNILKNKKGMGLPMVLGIITLVIGLTSTLLTFVFLQSRLVERQIEQTEAYVNAVSKIEATLRILERDKNMEENYLRDLSTYMGVDISIYGTNLYQVKSMVSDTRYVSSFMTGTTIKANTFELIFEKTGEEPDFYLSPLVTPTNMLSSYLPDYIETNFPQFYQPQSFSSFQSVIDYTRDLALQNQGFEMKEPIHLTSMSTPTPSGHWFVNGSVSLMNGQRLTIPENRLLIIDGDLTIRPNGGILGNVVVNGTVRYVSHGNSTEMLQGTIYANGNVNFDNRLTLGTLERPSFVFSEFDIILGNNTTGYAYFLSQNFTAKQGNIYLTGGVYTVFSPTIQKDIQENPDLNTSVFFDYAIPILIEVENTDPVTGEIKDFRYTSPKLNS